MSVYKHETSESEARFWAGQFAKEKGDRLSRAVIYRTNAQSLSFEKALREAKIPYRVIGALKFYEREEIKDAIAYLKCMDNPKDQVAFLRIVNKPARGLGKKGIEPLLRHLESSSFLDVWLSLKEVETHVSSTVSAKLQKFLQAVNAFRDDLYDLSPQTRQSENLAVAITQLFMDLDLFSYYRKLDEKEFSEKLLNLEEFVASAVEYDATAEDLRAFLETTELAPEREEGETGEPSISPIALLTAHASKGLEFDQVLISGLEEGLFPLNHSEAGMGLEDLEEERRLFYVAMTRARAKLSLSFCSVRTARGKRYSVNMSPFLREIPEDLLTVFKTKDPVLKKPTGKSFFYPSMGDDAPRRDNPWSRGDLIFHSRLGEGEILDAWARKGELYVRVAFEDGQERVLMPEYDKLEKI